MSSNQLKSAIKRIKIDAKEIQSEGTANLTDYQRDLVERIVKEATEAENLLKAPVRMAVNLKRYRRG